MKARHSLIVLAIMAGLCVSAAAFSAPITSAPPASAQPGSKSRLSSAQLAEAQARVDLANQIAQNVSADAKAKGASDSWRIGLLSVLYNTPSTTLRSISDTAKTLDQVHAQAADAQSRATAPNISGTKRLTSANDAVAADLGSSSDSLVFTPKTPCRFIDTRNVGGPIGTTARAFNTARWGSSYGGDSGCTLPGGGEPAVAANITLVSPSAAPGYLSIRPAGSSSGTSWVNWYTSGPTVQVGNAGIVATALNGSGDYVFEIFTGIGTAQVVLDYFGFFSASPSTSLDCYDTPLTTITIPVGGSNAGASPSCNSGYSRTGGSCFTSHVDNYVVYQGAWGAGWTCAWENATAVDQTGSTGATCCRVP